MVVTIQASEKFISEVLGECSCVNGNTVPKCAQTMTEGEGVGGGRPPSLWAGADWSG